MPITDQPSALRTSARNCTGIVKIRGTIPHGTLRASDGTRPTANQIRATLDDKPIDTFDDLFEPFDLEGRPGEEAGEERPQRRPLSHSTRSRSASGAEESAPRSAVPCPSCGSPNPPLNRHCESCGARLVRGSMPVAPQPMLRTTAGARALMVLAAVILTVAVLALVVNVFRDGEDSSAATSSSTTSTTTATLNIVELQPIRADCSSELASYPCSALYDDDPTNSWNATEGGVGTEITFFFSPPVQITEMFIHNLEEEERFMRNARMKGVEIVIDDLPQATVEELLDTNEPQRVQIRSLRTSSLTLRITSAYPGQSFDGREPFRELAAQEITFYGRVSPEVGG